MVAVAALASPIASAFIWVEYRAGSDSASSAGGAAGQDHWDAGPLVRPDLSSRSGTLAAARTLAQVAFQAIFVTGNACACAAWSARRRGARAPAAGRGGGDKRAARGARRPGYNWAGKGATIVVLCGPAWSWVATLLLEQRLHTTWTAGLGVGGLAAGAAGTLEAGWQALQLPVGFYWMPHVLALGAILAGWVQATTHARMPLDWAAWAAHVAQCMATASGLIALSRAG